MELQGHAADYAARHVTVVGISVDTPARSRALAAKLGTAFPLVSDPERRIIRAYGVEDSENGIAWPALFIVDRRGVVRWRWLREAAANPPPSATLLRAIDALAP